MTTASNLTTAQVWRVVSTTSTAVLAHVTPSGEPRSSGVVYATIDRRLYIAVAPTSWKARHIATGDHVAMTVLVRRGGLLSLMFPIPPASISLHGVATVHPAGSPEIRPLLAGIASLLPSGSENASCLIEVAPEGEFLTYGIGVTLTAMRTPSQAGGRVPVS